MRIALIRIAASFVFAALIVKADAFAQLTKLNVGYVGITSDNAAAFIARDTGIYARNGLDVQLIYFNSGSTAVTALITGDTPVSQTAGPGVINATMNGADAVMIAGGNVTLDYWMLSRPEIKTPEQLKGGAVAISRFGSASDFIVRYALQRLGLTPVKDVAILQVGSLTERLAAMETKRVQATVLAPPAASTTSRAIVPSPKASSWPRLNTLPAASGESAARAIARTTSSTWRQSRSCWPSP